MEISKRWVSTGGGQINGAEAEYKVALGQSIEKGDFVEKVSMNPVIISTEIPDYGSMYAKAIGSNGIFLLYYQFRNGDYSFYIRIARINADDTLAISQEYAVSTLPSDTGTTYIGKIHELAYNGVAFSITTNTQHALYIVRGTYNINNLTWSSSSNSTKHLDEVIGWADTVFIGGQTRMVVAYTNYYNYNPQYQCVVIYDFNTNSFGTPLVINKGPYDNATEMMNSNHNYLTPIGWETLALSGIAYNKNRFLCYFLYITDNTIELIHTAEEYTSNYSSPLCTVGKINEAKGILWYNIGNNTIRFKIFTINSNKTVSFYSSNVDINQSSILNYFNLNYKIYLGTESYDATNKRYDLYYYHLIDNATSFALSPVDVSSFQNITEIGRPFQNIMRYGSVVYTFADYGESNLNSPNHINVMEFNGDKITLISSQYLYGFYQISFLSWLGYVDANGDTVRYILTQQTGSSSSFKQLSVYKMPEFEIKKYEYLFNKFPQGVALETKNATEVIKIVEPNPIN